MSTMQHLLLYLQHLLWQCEKAIYVSHIRRHSKLPGPLTQGKATVDSLFQVMLILSAYDQALQLYQKFHLNSHYLQYHTDCSHAAAIKIKTQCSSCASFHTHPSIGVNPRGLIPNEL